MQNIHQQIKKLESEVHLLDIMRSAAKTDGGRLTTFGQDFIFSCNKNGIKPGDIAKILDVTPSAISQQISKIK